MWCISLSPDGWNLSGRCQATHDVQDAQNAGDATQDAQNARVRREPISKSCEITQADNLNRRRRLSRKAQ